MSVNKGIERVFSPLPEEAQIRYTISDFPTDYPDKWAEELNVTFEDGFVFSLERGLTGEVVPPARTKIDISEWPRFDDYSQIRYLKPIEEAVADERFCSNPVSEDGDAVSVGGACLLEDASGDEEISYGCNGVRATQKFLEAGRKLAPFYATTLGEFLRMKRNKVTEIRSFNVDKNGKTTEFYNVAYTSGVWELDKALSDWKEARDCEKLRLLFLEGKNTSDHLYNALGCFEHETITPGLWRVFYDKPKYDVSLVGKDEPPKPPVEVKRIYVSAGGDGKVGYVDASWFGSPGKFEIGARSLYTAELLDYFEPVMSGVVSQTGDFDVYEYRVKSAFIPAGGVSEGNLVEEGDFLFSYYDGHGYREVHAPVDGVVKSMESSVGLYLELVPAGFQEWYKPWFVASGL